MAKPILRRQRENGQLQVVYDDGSVKTFDSDYNLLSSSGPNADLASALSTGDSLTDRLAELDAFTGTRYYQDILEAQRQQAQTDADRFDRTFGLQRDQFRADRDYRTASLGLERERLGLSSRELDARIAELERRFGLDQSRLGLDYLQTAAQLSGPADYFQAADFAAGARARQDVPIFVQRLMQGQNPQTGTAAPAGTPTPLTMEGLAARLTGGGGGASGDTTVRDAQAVMKALPPSGAPGLSSQDQAALNAIGEIYKRGAQALAPGALENLDESDLALMTSGGRKLGFDVGRFARDYRTTRLPTGLASASAA